jgi:DNA-binding NarL/FixJ family response regulator
MPIRVLVADDYLPFRVMLRHLLDDEPDLEVVAEASDGEQVVRLAEEIEPDVVLLDLAMPRLDGWEAIPLLRRVAPGTAIVVLSGFPESRMTEVGLRSSVQRYVEKGAAQEVICAAVRDAGAQGARTAQGAGT